MCRKSSITTIANALRYFIVGNNKNITSPVIVDLKQYPVEKKCMSDNVAI